MTSELQQVRIIKNEHSLNIHWRVPCIANLGHGGHFANIIGIHIPMYVRAEYS